MKQAAKWGLCVAFGLCVAPIAVMSTDSWSADAKKGPKPAAQPAAPVDPPNVKNAQGIQLSPSGIHWGMTPDELAQFYDGVIDGDYAPLYKKAQSGPQTNRLDAEVQNAKAAFRRSKVEFGNLPTGVDSTPMKGEYTYRNQEAMMGFNRRGAGQRYFFFIRGKLWKIYDEARLFKGGPLGETFEEATKKYEEAFGVAGRVTQADYSANRPFAEVDWQDQKTHLRLVDRSGTGIAGAVYEERATLTNLASYRLNKPVDQDAVDPSIQSLVRPPSDQPGPKGPDAGAGKKGGKSK
jgi:hypothetical protein